MSKRILVVEDEPDIVKIVIFRLRKAGYEVTHAMNGKEALDILRKEPRFHLIVLDLVMPVMDGHELCRILHKNNAYTDIPVIILSASATKDLRERTRELHASDYILKPFETDILLSKVKDLIGS
jgi:CheY-like chemotaxis protein